MKKRRLKLYKNKPIEIAFSCYSGSEECCGDSCSWEQISEKKTSLQFNAVRNAIISRESKTAVALSDGMGKGEQAARESSKAINAVIALLKAGMDPEMALQVLNLLWSMSNRKELFPTMDLALLDPQSRELVIYKIGAAPTVIVRAPRCRPGHFEISVSGQNFVSGNYGAPRKSSRSGNPEESTSRGKLPPGNFEILTAPAMPMGVSEYSEILGISTIVMPDDLIIMMTDGVADSLRSDTELDWLRRLLSRIKSRNLQTICDLIVREAALNYGSREKDDMTVVIIEV